MLLPPARHQPLLYSDLLRQALLPLRCCSALNAAVWIERLQRERLLLPAPLSLLASYPLAEGRVCRCAAAGSALGGAVGGGAGGGAGGGVGEGAGGEGEGWRVRLSLRGGRLCDLRGQLAVVTEPASGSIHGSEARTRTKQASVRQQA